MRAQVCKECGKARPRLAVEHGDEFCSTTCAKRHYGTAEARLPRRGVVIRVPHRVWKERLRRVS